MVVGGKIQIWNPDPCTKKFNLDLLGGGFTLSPFMHLYPGQQIADAS